MGGVLEVHDDSEQFSLELLHRDVLVVLQNHVSYTRQICLAWRVQVDPKILAACVDYPRRAG
jgi:hypothetical protein